MKNMKNWKQFNESWFKSKKTSLTQEPKTYKDEDKVLKIFNQIKLNYIDDNLSIYDSGLYGRYFRYKFNDSRLDCGITTISIGKDIQDVSKSLISNMESFFETKKGSIRDNYSVGF